jgi:hypothetical protein
VRRLEKVVDIPKTVRYLLHILRVIVCASASSSEDDSYAVIPSVSGDCPREHQDHDHQLRTHALAWRE